MAQPPCRAISQTKAREKTITESLKQRPWATPAHSDSPSASFKTLKTHKSKPSILKSSTLKMTSKRQRPTEAAPTLEPVPPKQAKQSKPTYIPPQP